MLIAVSSVEDSGCGPAMAGITPGLSLLSCNRERVLGGANTCQCVLVDSLAGSRLPQAVLWSPGSRGFPCGKGDGLRMEVEAFPSMPCGPLGVRVSFLLPVLFGQFCSSWVEFVCLSLPAGPG